MSRGRFALLLSLLCLVVAVASFAVVLRLLDDDAPGGADGTAEPDDPADGTGDGSTTTAVPVDGDGVLDTPAFVVIVASEGSEAEAQDGAESVQEAGYPAGYLHSDDFESLTPGFWVAFAGPYADAAAASAQIEPLAGDGFPGAYVRCVGTADECR